VRGADRNAKGSPYVSRVPTRLHPARTALALPTPIRVGSGVFVPDRSACFGSASVE
jgi:hypothetical protein